MDALTKFGEEIAKRAAEGSALAFFVLMLALLLGPILAERSRLPAMVGLVLGGMLIGAHGLGLLDENKVALSAWGSFGLLYLMFAAGLELDLKLLAKYKRAAITFAALSFAIPCALGIISARFLGYAWAGAILMGSNWASHTLVTYPMLRQMGLAKNRAVATVVGATAITDTSALLVLAGVAGSVRKTSSLGLEALEIGAGLVAIALWTLLALPRIARWFFGRVGTQQAYRFVFGTVALLSGAVLAQLGGIDEIVGAFFAGLGLVRAIPSRSALMERVQFVGSALFIPIFLISVGVLLDPKVLVDPRTILHALVFTGAVLIGKTTAAVIAGRTFHFSWPEIGVMSGLSGSQAAATLATTLIGARLGLFDSQTVNAVLVVILMTLVITSLVAAFFGKRVHATSGEKESLGSVVMVPVWGEQTHPLLTLAGRIADVDGGIVLAAGIAPQHASDADVAAQRAVTQRAEEWLAHEGLESKTVFRLSTSSAMGTWETVRGEHASLLFTEWTDSELERMSEGGEAMQLLADSPIPVVLAHGSLETFGRIVLLSADEDTSVAAELASRLAAGHELTFVGRGDADAKTLFGSKLAVRVVDTHDPLRWAAEHARADDLLVLQGLAAVREALRRLPNLVGRKFLVAVSSHQHAPA